MRAPPKSFFTHPAGSARNSASVASTTSQDHLGAPSSGSVSTRSTSATAPHTLPCSRPNAMATMSARNSSSSDHLWIHVPEASSTPVAWKSRQPGGRWSVPDT